MNLPLGVDPTNLPDRGLESAVFSALRKMGLLRTKKSGKTFLMFSRSDDGTFPSELEVRQALAHASQARAEDANNKEGVVVSECQSRSALMGALPRKKIVYLLDSDCVDGSFNRIA